MHLLRAANQKGPVVLLFLFALALVATSCNLRSGVPVLERRGTELNKAIMCPICPGESIDQAQNTLAIQMRGIVRDKLAEDIRSCRTDSALRCGNDLFGLMLLTRAPPGIPTSTTATWFIEAWWSAVYEPKNPRWLVVSMTDASANGSPGSLYFYVYERTGLVEGIAPTSQQTLDTVLRFLDEICRNDKGACTNQRSWEEIRTGSNLSPGS